MATTLKAMVLEQKLRADKTWNVKIRLTHNRQSVYISTPHYVTKQQLNKNFEIKDIEILDMLNADVRRMRGFVSELSWSGDSMTAKAMAEHLESRLKNKSQEIDFIAYATKKSEELIAGSRQGTGRNHRYMINRLVEFTKKPTLNISAITVKFLNDFAKWLSEREGMGARGVSLYTGSIRTLFNLARDEFNDEDSGIMPIKHYPFAKFKVPQQAQTRKRALSVEDIRRIRDYTPTGVLDTIAQDAFLLSLNLAGMNSVDMYNCNTLIDGRIVYQRAKTYERRSDNAEISIPILPSIASLVEKYIDKSGSRVFLFYKMYSDKNTFNSAINRGLKIIGAALGIENLTFYAARHSMATILRNDLGFSKDDISACLNHADTEHRVTDIYLAKDFSVIDRAMTALANYINSD